MEIENLQKVFEDFLSITQDQMYDSQEEQIVQDNFYNTNGSDFFKENTFQNQFDEVDENDDTQGNDDTKIYYGHYQQDNDANDLDNTQIIEYDTGDKNEIENDIIEQFLIIDHHQVQKYSYIEEEKNEYSLSKSITIEYKLKSYSDISIKSFKSFHFQQQKLESEEEQKNLFNLSASAVSQIDCQIDMLDSKQYFESIKSFHEEDKWPIQKNQFNINNNNLQNFQFEEFLDNEENKLSKDKRLQDIQQFPLQNFKNYQSKFQKYTSENIHFEESKEISQQIYYNCFSEKNIQNIHFNNKYEIQNNFKDFQQNQSEMLESISFESFKFEQNSFLEEKNQDNQESIISKNKQESQNIKYEEKIQEESENEDYIKNILNIFIQEKQFPFLSYLQSKKQDLKQLIEDIDIKTWKNYIFQKLIIKPIFYKNLVKKFEFEYSRKNNKTGEQKKYQQPTYKEIIAFLQKSQDNLELINYLFNQIEDIFKTSQTKNKIITQKKKILLIKKLIINIWAIDKIINNQYSFNQIIKIIEEIQIN